MFIHNLRYNIKILFNNKVLIFWTFIFPIILGVFFNMAFSNIESDEMLKVFDIAVVDNDEFRNDEVYVKTLDALSSGGDDKLFNIKYTDKDDADILLEDSEIEGYIYFSSNKPNVVIRKNGMNQTVLRYVVNEIEQNKIIYGDVGFVQNIKSNVKMIDVSKDNLSYMQIEYYSLIAMAVMYGGMLGLTAINNSLANMSDKGKRIAVSPNKKSNIVLSAIIGSYLVSLVGLTILMIFLKFMLHADFGSNLGLVILLLLVGDLAGISLGVLIASALRVSEGAKTGITIAISMFLSVLSGMTGVTLKYVIDKNVPILNLINPCNLITDGFYSLYYYDTLNRYFRDVCFLLIFVLIAFVVSFASLRREKYDSI